MKVLHKILIFISWVALLFIFMRAEQYPMVLILLFPPLMLFLSFGDTQMGEEDDFRKHDEAVERGKSRSIKELFSIDPKEFMSYLTKAKTLIVQGDMKGLLDLFKSWGIDEKYIKKNMPPPTLLTNPVGQAIWGKFAFKVVRKYLKQKQSKFRIAKPEGSDSQFWKNVKEDKHISDENIKENVVNRSQALILLSAGPGLTFHNFHPNLLLNWRISYLTAARSDSEHDRTELIIDLLSSADVDYIRAVNDYANGDLNAYSRVLEIISNSPIDDLHLDNDDEIISNALSDSECTREGLKKILVTKIADVLTTRGEYELEVKNPKKLTVDIGGVD